MYKNLIASSGRFNQSKIIHAHTKHAHECTQSGRIRKKLSRLFSKNHIANEVGMKDNRLAIQHVAQQHDYSVPLHEGKN